MVAPPVVALGNSLRARPLSDTLAIARDVGRRAGIVRVTDITRLDRLGVPVFAAIRPAAAPGALCVHAGKGLDPIEAQVGAWMEGIEHAYAEPRLGDLVVADPRKLPMPGATIDDLPQLGPLLDAALGGIDRLAYVKARDLADGSPYLLPAELVYVPFPARPGERALFGSSSNGLASGNSIDEATAHALGEIVERDVLSFDRIEDTSSWVDPATLPEELASWLVRIEAAACRLTLRVSSRVHSPVVASAYLVDEELEPDPLWMFAGSGCHARRAIALARAMTEAAQSRLTFIHGARDDLTDRFRALSVSTAEERRAAAGRLRERWFRRDRRVRYEDLADAGTSSFTETSELYLRALNAGRAFRVVLTPDDAPLAVVRMIVSGAECFTAGLPRVGPRLAAHADDAALRRGGPA